MTVVPNYDDPETWGNDVLRRFQKKVAKAKNGCHLWTAYKTPDGYGQFWLYVKNIYAHRFIYQYISKEKLKTEDEVCHTCDVPYCVNYGHLFVGTHGDNIEDSIRKGRAFVGRGQNNGMARLTENCVLEIRRLSRKGISAREISEVFSVTEQTVWDVASFRTWREVLDVNAETDY